MMSPLKQEKELSQTAKEERNSMNTTEKFPTDLLTTTHYSEVVKCTIGNKVYYIKREIFNQIGPSVGLIELLLKSDCAINLSNNQFIKCRYPLTQLIEKTYMT